MRLQAQTRNLEIPGSALSGCPGMTGTRNSSLVWLAAFSTAIFADYARRYRTGFAPVWGPSGALRERLVKGEAFDVFASAASPAH
jgi:hypothetical protein